MLHELEYTLGQPLFDRVGRGLRLNQAGERTLGYFRGIRGSIEALNKELINLHEGHAGRLEIGSILAASSKRLTDSLIALKAANPQLTVNINFDTSDRLIRQLQDGSIEIVIGRGFDSNNKDHVFYPIGDEVLVLVASRAHPLARKKQVSFSDLLDYQWALQPQGSPARAVIENEFRTHNMPLPEGLIETASIITMIDLVDRSMIISPIPEDIAVRNQKHGVISIINYKLSQKLSSYGVLVRRERPLTPSAQQFLDLFC